MAFSPNNAQVERELDSFLQTFFSLGVNGSKAVLCFHILPGNEVCEEFYLKPSIENSESLSEVISCLSTHKQDIPEFGNIVTILEQIVSSLVQVD